MSMPYPRAPASVASVGAVDEAAPRPTLQVVDAMALIVGIVVGAGIFRTPPLVAANVGSEAAVLAAWAIGGAISLVGALCYAELATAYPNPGGDYHFLTRAFGRRLAFLYGWARLTVIQTGSMALLAYVVGDYASQVVVVGGVPGVSSAVYAVLTLVSITALNVAGVRQGKTAQNLLTAAEVLGLLLVVATGLAFVVPASAAGAVASPGVAPAASAFGLAMVFVLFTYGGWNEAAYVSAEVHEPRRNMVRALVWSILVVTALYLLVNWAYLRGLGLAGVAGSAAVAADLVERSMGNVGRVLVSLLIVLAALTAVNATVITGARTAYAVGRDHRPLRFLGRWHAGAGTPVNALLVQGAVAVALVLLGALTRRGFETMVDYTAPVFWLFFLLTGLSVFVLRHRDPRAPRPFRVPLYPLLPLVFCATCVYLLYASLRYTGVGALVGVAVLTAGAIVLFLLSPREAGSAAPR